MVLVGCTGAAVDLGGPSTAVPTVVGESGQGDAQPLVASPPEMHRLLFAGVLGDRYQAGERRDGFRSVIGLPGIAPFGDYLGGVDDPGAGERPNDLPVGMFV